MRVFQRFSAVAVGAIALLGCLPQTEAGSEPAELKAESQSTLEQDIAKVDEILQAKLQLKAKKIMQGPMDDYLTVISDQGMLFVAKDGSRLIAGNIYDLGGQMENLGDKSMSPYRSERLSSYEDTMIVYPAAGEEKYQVTVFTDTDCGYCRKLHRQMAEYQDEGITVRYLAYPRAGVQSKTGQEMAAIWCADDKKGAMDQAKAGQTITAARCDDHVIEQHYNLGREFGVSGTPAMVLKDGTMLPGYLPPKALLQKLKEA